ncbi:hypothetical protein [Massilia sp. TS11]|uniref:hypothetical protein n=1 Tax=Massilia sp. TS11 TaxID=2908003 RepID=UPI001EDA8381|nr:hypothetical protein [Massilia sp. TS11]MCG2585603.1 hypothetical protein [Massilia sp. TS11]
MTLALMSAPHTQTAKLQACPRFAPRSWNIGSKPLETIRVISYPRGTTLGNDRDEYDGPPWEEIEKSGFIYQTWIMNEDAPAFIYEVDCTYAGTERYVSLDVANARKCTGRWRARRDHGVVPFSLIFSCR